MVTGLPLMDTAVLTLPLVVATSRSSKGGVIRKEEGVTVNGHIDPKGHWIGERKVIHVADYSPASHFDIFMLDTMVKDK